MEKEQQGRTFSGSCLGTRPRKFAEDRPEVGEEAKIVSPFPRGSQDLEQGIA